ncbi:CHC2 zinc finger domain-containing protein [Nonomuraea sp. NPDC052129]|uniref:CHC2 zinc finger domain-containing protein n=1 Tax=Nonomuraea sp. NPDC052129 TaxID=3154651 RepID=UPI00342FD219
MPTNTRITDRDIALVRDHNPIYSVVLESNVDLTDTDDGNAKGLCPFHEVRGERETTPSFHVTPERGMYFCFGCGEGGDVITFVMKRNNLTFAEAVQRLAERAGVELSYAAEQDPAPVLAGWDNLKAASRNPLTGIVLAICAVCLIVCAIVLRVTA